MNQIQKNMEISPINFNQNYNNIKTVKYTYNDKQAMVLNSGKFSNKLVKPRKYCSMPKQYQTNSTSHQSSMSTPQNMQEPSPLNSDFIYYKKNASGFKNKKISPSNRDKDKLREKSKPKGHIRHISMDICSTIHSPYENLEFDIKVEQVSSVGFKKCNDII